MHAPPRRVQIRTLGVGTNREFINGYMMGPEVHLVWRQGEERKQTRILPDWWFYVRTQDAQDNRELFQRLKKRGHIRKIEPYEMDESYLRVFCQNNNLYASEIGEGASDGKTETLSALTEAGIRTYEADLTPLQRLVVETDLRISRNYKVVYLDIETRDVGPDGKTRVPIAVNFRGEATGALPVLSFAAWFRSGKSKFVRAKTEEAIHEIELFREMFRILEWADVVVTFNGNKFDWPYIRARAELHGLKFRWKRLIHVDLCDRMQQVHKQNTKVQSFSLEALSQQFLGEGKIKHPGMTTYDMWSARPDMLEAYNLRDVELLWKLDVKEKLLEFLFYQSRLCGIFASQFGSYNLIDGWILRRARTLGTPLPTAKRPSKVGKFRGAYVVDPVPGIYRDIAVYDFKSLYPSIIRSWNIGSHNFFHGDPPAGVSATRSALQEESDLNPLWFRLDERSPLADAVEAFLVERARCRQRMKDLEREGKDAGEWTLLDMEQNAWKILANSTYGITAAGHRMLNRYYSQEVAESITVGGEYINRHTHKLFAHWGSPVVSGDTDSTFAVLSGNDPEELRDRVNRELPAILEREYGVPPERCCIELNFEKKYNSLLIGRKKCYVGYLDGSDKPVAKGLEYIKRDTPEITKVIQRKLVEGLLAGGRTTEDWHKWARKIQRRILFDTIPSDQVPLFIVHKKVSKELGTYKTKGAHVRVMEEKRAAGEEVYRGMTLRLIYVTPNADTPGKEDALDYEDFRLRSRSLDRKKYWEAVIWSKLQYLLEAVFPHEDWAQYSLVEAERRGKMIQKYLEAKTKKDYYRHFRAHRAEVLAASWIPTAKREEILFLDQDEERLMEKLLSRMIGRAVDKIQDAEEIPDPCSKCGEKDLLSGTVETSRTRNTVRLCRSCGYQKKKRLDSTGPVEEDIE